MMELRVLLTAEAPLALRIGRSPSRNETLAFVPGQRLLGGLAQAHSILGRPEEEFARFFLQGDVLLGNCYPANFRHDQLRRDRAPVLPVPRTARTCKRFDGFSFTVENEDEDRAGVTDALIPLTLFELSGRSRPELLDSLKKHPKTGQSLRRVDGFYRRGPQLREMGQPENMLGLRTRTGINPATGTVQSGVLYSRQVLAAGTSFWGHWNVADHCANAFRDFLRETDEQNLLRIGSNRSRGLGLLSINVREQSRDTDQTLAARISTFNQLLHEHARQHGMQLDAGSYVPITLTSDLIAHDELLRSRLRLQAQDLQGIEGAELVFHEAGTRQIEGWSALWGMPKKDDWAIAMGSVFVFRLPDLDDANVTTLLQIQTHGLGERRIEGFGQLSIADVFHNDLAGGVYL